MVKLIENFVFGLSFLDMITDYSLLHVAFIAQPTISTMPLFIGGFIFFVVSTYLRFSFLPMYLDACYNLEYPVFDEDTREWIPKFKNEHLRIAGISAVPLIGLSLYLIYEHLHERIGLFSTVVSVIAILVVVMCSGYTWLRCWYCKGLYTIEDRDKIGIHKYVLDAEKGILYRKYIVLTLSLIFPFCWFTRGVWMMVTLAAALLCRILVAIIVLILKFVLLPCDIIVGMGYYTATGNFELLIYKRLFPDITFPPDFELLKVQVRGIMCLAIMGGRGIVKLVKDNEQDKNAPILHLLAPVFWEEIFENIGGVLMSVAVLQYDGIADIVGILAVLSLAASILSTLMETGFLYANCVENNTAAPYSIKKPNSLPELNFERWVSSRKEVQL